MPRGYTSPVREEASAQTRQTIIESALDIMRGEAGASFTVDQVAKCAGVTRLTVYNQFGSRLGLLEAIFDDRARAGGLDRMPDVMAIPDARVGLRRLVQLFCEFWQSDPALFRLVAEGSADPEFAASLAERDERRRKAIAVFLSRMSVADSAKGPRTEVLADLLLGMTGSAMFRAVAARRPTTAAAAAVGDACDALVSAWIADVPPN